MNKKNFFIVLFSIMIATACNSQTSNQSLTATAFNEKIKEQNNSMVLDVRTPEEYADGYIANAMNIDYRNASFEQEISKLDKDKIYYVYCLSGKRSASAKDIMLKNGFKNVVNLEGGILAWQAANLPLTATNTTATTDEISMDMYKQMITSDTLVLVDFYAPWCGSCIKMKPMLEEISTDYIGKVKVIRLNIDENKQLAKDLQIVEIPVLKTYLKGSETWMHKGYIEKADLVKHF